MRAVLLPAVDFCSTPLFMQKKRTGRSGEFLEVGSQARAFGPGHRCGRGGGVRAASDDGDNRRRLEATPRAQHLGGSATRVEELREWRLT